MEAIRIDDSNPAVQFTSVALPNEWGKIPLERKDISKRGLIYKEFFKFCLTSFGKSTGSRMLRLRNRKVGIHLLPEFLASHMVSLSLPKDFRLIFI